MSSSFLTELAELVKRNLTDDLRNERFKLSKSKLAGHCYVASEALYHLLGGKKHGWKPMFIKHENESHWFIKNEFGTILDPTAEQFETKIDYSKAKGKGFLTTMPSRRTSILLKRIKNERR